MRKLILDADKELDSTYIRSRHMEELFGKGIFHAWGVAGDPSAFNLPRDQRRRLSMFLAAHADLGPERGRADLRVA